MQENTPLCPAGERMGLVWDGCREEGMRGGDAKRSLQLKQPDPAKEEVLRQDSMIPPAAHPSTLH